MTVDHVLFKNRIKEVDVLGCFSFEMALHSGVVVGEMKTVLQSMGEKSRQVESWKEIVKESTSKKVCLVSHQDETYCFQEISRRCLEKEICNEAITLARLECSGCRRESNGKLHLVAQHGLCNKTPAELLEKYPSFFMGYLFARQIDSFFIDTPFFVEISPYMKEELLLDGEWVKFGHRQALLYWVYFFARRRSISHFFALRRLFWKVLESGK